MSTVKITQLPIFGTINANTANTVFAGVDVPTDTTFQMSAHTLAQGLYSNEILNVGINQQNLPNTIAQFSLKGESYIQTNLVNTSDGGTADIVVTANSGSGGTDSAHFIDMGYANKNYQPGLEFNNIGNAISPLDGYLYSQGSQGANTSNLVIGVTTSNSQLKFIVGGGSASNIVAKMTSTGLSLNTQSILTFGDGSTQSVAASPANYSQAAFSLANTLNTTVIYQTGVNLQQNTNITAVNTYAASGYTQANAATNSAQSGYNLANTVSITSNAAFIQANAAFLQANAATVSAQSGYNLANTVSTTSNAAFIQANAAFSQANATNTYAVSGYAAANTAAANTVYSFGVDLQQNTNITAVNTYAASAYNLANTANAAVTYQSGVDVQQNTNITAVNTYASSGYAQANSAAANTIYQTGVNATQNTLTQTVWNLTNTAVQNTSTIILNNLNLNGNLIANTTTTTASFNKVNILGNNDGSLTINNSSFSAQTALVKIISSTGFASQTPQNSGYMLQIVGMDNVPTRIVFDSASVSGNAYGLIAGRTSRGSAASPSAVQAGDVLMRFSGNGYGTTNYSQLGVGKIDIVAAENFTDTNKGSLISFGVTRIGANSVTTNVVAIGANTVSFGSSGFTSANAIIDMANSRIQVSNTSNKVAYAVSYINSAPSYPNGSAGDKKGMMFLDTGNAIGNGLKLYWCNADYTTGSAQIWWYGTTNQGTWA